MSYKYLLDTNILIYYFNGNSVVLPIFDEIQAGSAVGYYCPITWVELLCYTGLTDEQRHEIRTFLRKLSCISLTDSVLDSAAEIRCNYRIGLADALIAACALVENCTLVTRNVEDFRRIAHLTILNPFD